jgi:hypothetical protein
MGSKMHHADGEGDPTQAHSHVAHGLVKRQGQRQGGDFHNTPEWRQHTISNYLSPRFYQSHPTSLPNRVHRYRQIEFANESPSRQDILLRVSRRQAEPLNNQLRSVSGRYRATMVGFYHLERRRNGALTRFSRLHYTHSLMRPKNNSGSSD